MIEPILPVLLFVAIAAAVSVGLVVFAQLIGPKRPGAVKEMPYESGMDPLHDTRRRFDIRFHLVAITFLVFDVELLFLYPWAVASRTASGIDAAVSEGLVSSRLLVFFSVLFFIAMVVIGFVYDWRKGVFRWR
ncbi:MAG: NADH-quinone oxidoreductase subunit A [Planctomycetota bacterium]|jgi:NADH-quinone oxidoreductase subunit A|nr:NADH-quinone oxidoreductase subunit A [Planctomycetia bacterium]MDO7678143.1 NADH-quinone oxidoreductase subunit A [Pirellulales bacterium]RLS21237.1 MAG: NADH-quinone oxidoreductase subunit A [Planctomycetota bacterium]TSA09274.1 MAG: NADH-quinone oxidoreductase subunit A [Planctomycetaceae bacterium]RLS30265.1 MAG: NADH-quinone oxidoreductase subunit A [Planctomycetota bacterium]